MLKITIPSRELFDEKTYIITQLKGGTIALEHSLVSISKWEQKWKKPYLTKKNNKSSEEFLDYIRCMTITQNVDPMLYFGLTADNFNEINAYIEDPMSARNIAMLSKGGRHEQITNELIYYYMFSFNISKECEKWHFNRLLNLIMLFSEKNQNDKKRRVTRDDIVERDRLNNERKAKWNTEG